MLLRSCLWLLGAALLASAAVGQAPPQSGKEKGEPTKAKEPAKGKLPADKSDKATSEKPPADKPKQDKLKLPPGSVLILDDGLKEGSDPKLAVMPWEKYQELLEQLQALKKQLKSERLLPSACKLSGRVEGDFAVLRAEFTFATELPRSTVLLGLQGSHLTDEGELDRQAPHLEFADDGFVVRVDKEGTHQLVLHLKIPVGLKRTGGPGSAAERGFDLGLPGAAVTTLTLELPAAVKEIRWNDNLEKQRVNNRWEIALGRAKSLSLSWKEPVSLPGNGPLLTADSQVQVKVDEAQVLVTADMNLEDLRGQTKQWQLLLPPSAKVEVKVPAGLTYELVPPDAKNPQHLIKLLEPSSERLHVNVQVRYPRPLVQPRIPIGPFVVQGAFRQQGTIAVHASVDVLRGQRLLFHRYGETFQRDLPKNPGDLVGLFQFWGIPAPGKGPKGAAARTSLELELRAEKGQAEASVEHALRLRPGAQGWVVESITQIHLKTRQQALDSLLVQWPQLPVPRFGLLAMPTAAFPANVPWPAFMPQERTTPAASPLGFTCDDETIEISPADSLGRVRLGWSRIPAKEFSVVLKGKYLVPPGAERIRIELPKPIGTIDRGGKTTVQVDDQLELHVGPPGGETPAPDRRQLKAVWDYSPDHVEIAWRPHRPELAVTAVVDVVLHERTAQAECRFTFQLPAGSRPGVPAPLRLHAPRQLRHIRVKMEGDPLSNTLHDPERETAWIYPAGEPGARVEVTLTYDFDLPQGGAADKDRTAPIPLVWLEAATRHDFKVRVWTSPGVLPRLVETVPGLDSWKDRGIESAAHKDTLPALVVYGAEPRTPLVLHLPHATSARLAAVVCDRCLIVAAVDEEGAHVYRARFAIRKVNTEEIDLEFPAAAAACLQNVWFDQEKVTRWQSPDNAWNVARVTVPAKFANVPFVLEVEYRLPSSFGEGKRPWQTTLFAPRFRGEAFVGKVRWQATVPDGWVSLAPVGQEFRWGLHGWLLGSQPAFSSAELDAWITGRDPVEAYVPVSLTLVRSNLDPVVVLHAGRSLWLVLCSALVLAVGLTLYLVPLSRLAFWSIVVGLAVGLVLVALWPAWLPILAMGVQPGAIVLLVLIGIHWALQERYRRQVVFLPAFTRLKTNSSLVRQGSGANRPREPSTIDAPTPMAAPSTGSGKGAGAPGSGVSGSAASGSGSTPSGLSAPAKGG